MRTPRSTSFLRSILQASFLLSSVAIPQTPLAGQVLRFTFEAVVDEVLEPQSGETDIPDDIVVGTTIQGTFVLDTQSQDFDVSNPTLAAWVGAGNRLSAGIGSCAFSRIGVDAPFTIRDDVTDIFRMGNAGVAGGACTGLQAPQFLLSLWDNSGTAFSSQAIPNDIELSDFPDLREIQVSLRAGTFADSASIGGTITSIAGPTVVGDGSTQNNPILPDIQRPGDFTFIRVVGGRWVDPPLAEGYAYSILSDSLFTAILDFPTGFSAPFTVSVDGAVIGSYSPGESVDFTGFPDGGVPSFTVTGISPAVDPNDPAAFPLQVDFNTIQADFRMQAITTTEVVVTIDIKPTSEDNSVNLGSSGVVPVAILSEPGFDATTVDPTTVSLAGADVKLKGKGTPMYALIDVNSDGLLDIEVKVSTQALELSDGDTEATLTAQTYDGTVVVGSDTIRIVP